jgi:hypothetical protein
MNSGQFSSPMPFTLQEAARNLGVVGLTPCVKHNLLETDSCFTLMRRAKTQHSFKPSTLKNGYGDRWTYLNCARGPDPSVGGTQGFCAKLPRQGDIRIKARDGNAGVLSPGYSRFMSWVGGRLMNVFPGDPSLATAADHTYRVTCISLLLLCV